MKKHIQLGREGVHEVNTATKELPKLVLKALGNKHFPQRKARAVDTPLQLLSLRGKVIAELVELSEGPFHRI
jgi:hypothetical protein